MPPQKATTGVSTLFLLKNLNFYHRCALSPTSPWNKTTTTTTLRWHRCSADRVSSMVSREKRGATGVVPSLGRRCSSATDTNKSSPPPYLSLSSSVDSAALGRRRKKAPRKFDWHPKLFSKSRALSYKEETKLRFPRAQIQSSAAKKRGKLRAQTNEPQNETKISRRADEARISSVGSSAPIILEKKKREYKICSLFLFFNLSIEFLVGGCVSFSLSLFAKREESAGGAGRKKKRQIRAGLPPFVRRSGLRDAPRASDSAESLSPESINK